MIKLVVGVKTKKPTYGCPRIAMLVLHLFNIDISEQTVRRILRVHYRPLPGDGPSYFSGIGNKLDGLWSIDFFRVESIFMRSNWVMIIMDIYSRQIIGFSVHEGNLTGALICQMFNTILLQSKTAPRYLSSDRDPLFQFKQWKRNLRIEQIDEVKSLPYIPISHPYIERVIGTTRREFLDKEIIWGPSDLKNKLDKFQSYYNRDRVHYSLEGKTPAGFTEGKEKIPLNINNYFWKSTCGGRYELPAAAFGPAWSARDFWSP